jgi:hypothetical protein
MIGIPPVGLSSRNRHRSGASASAQTLGETAGDAKLGTAGDIGTPRFASPPTFTATLPSGRLALDDRSGSVAWLCGSVQQTASLHPPSRRLVQLRPRNVRELADELPHPKPTSLQSPKTHLSKHSIAHTQRSQQLRGLRNWQETRCGAKIGAGTKLLCFCRVEIDAASIGSLRRLLSDPCIFSATGEPYTWGISSRPASSDGDCPYRLSPARSLSHTGYSSGNQSSPPMCLG